MDTFQVPSFLPVPVSKQNTLQGNDGKKCESTYEHIYCTSFPETEAPVYRPPLPPGASVTATAKRGECLRNPPGARLPRRVFLGRLGPTLLLGLCGLLHPREGHKSMSSFTLLDIRLSESPVSWHFRVDSLRPAGLSGQCWHTGWTPWPLVLSRDVNTDWGPTCTGSTDSLFRKSPKFKSTEATNTNITKYDSTEGPKSV